MAGWPPGQLTKSQGTDIFELGRLFRVESKHAYRCQGIYEMEFLYSLTQKR
jgi:hypothetical protein